MLRQSSPPSEASVAAIRRRGTLRLVLLVAMASGPGTWACDSGFEKVSEPEPEPEPEPEAVRTPDSGTTSGFEPSPLDFEASAEAALLSELGEGELRSLCGAEQRRLDEVLQHFSSDEDLCRIGSIREASANAATNTAYQNACSATLEGCLEEGPEAGLGDFVPEAAAALSCELWRATEDCDPELSETLACLDDLVENLVVRLSELGSCASTRAEVLPKVERLDALSSVTSPFALSNRCASVVCVESAPDGGVEAPSAADAGD